MGTRRPPRRGRRIGLLGISGGYDPADMRSIRYGPVTAVTNGVLVSRSVDENGQPLGPAVRVTLSSGVYVSQRLAYAAPDLFLAWNSLRTSLSDPRG